MEKYNERIEAQRERFVKEREAKKAEEAEKAGEAEKAAENTKETVSKEN